MGLRRVLIFAEVLLVLVEVPGFRSGLVALVAEARPRGVSPAVSGRTGSGGGTAGDHELVCPLLGTCSLGGWTEASLVRTSSRHVQSAPAHDLLRQPRRLPDLYAIVVRDERGQLPARRGRNKQLTRSFTFKPGTVLETEHRLPASLLPSVFAPLRIPCSRASPSRD
jgi:hypothetical protein